MTFSEIAWEVFRFPQLSKPQPSNCVRRERQSALEGHQEAFPPTSNICLRTVRIGDPEQPRSRKYTSVFFNHQRQTTIASQLHRRYLHMEIEFTCTCGRLLGAQMADGKLEPHHGVECNDLLLRGSIRRGTMTMTMATSVSLLRVVAKYSRRARCKRQREK